MTNKHASKQHCLVGNIRPKSKKGDRLNKEKAAGRRSVAQEAQKERLQKALEARIAER